MTWVRSSGGHQIRRASAAAANSTLFPLTENPISESNSWFNGKVDALAWNNMQTGSGHGYGVNSSPTDDDDNIACRKGAFTNNQFIEGIVFRAGGYSPAIVHEIELHLHCTMTANNITSYELLFNSAGSWQCVRWDGALNNFFTGMTVTDHNGGPVAVANNDVIRFEVTNNNFSVFQNTILTRTFTDSTWPSGTPGFAAFWHPDASIVPSSFGFSKLTWGNLP